MTILYRIRTGIERFYHRYPNYPRREAEYLGIGAMIDATLFERLKSVKREEILKNE